MNSTLVPTTGMRCQHDRKSQRHQRLDPDLLSFTEMKTSFSCVGSISFVLMLAMKVSCFLHMMLKRVGAWSSNGRLSLGNFHQYLDREAEYCVFDCSRGLRGWSKVCCSSGVERSLGWNDLARGEGDCEDLLPTFR